MFENSSVSSGLGSRKPPAKAGGRFTNKRCVNCGRFMPHAIIFNTDAFSVSRYFSWVEDGEGRCIKCFEAEGKA